MTVVVHGEVQEKHPVVGHLREQRAKRLIIPYIALIAEHPSLHHPGGTGISAAYRLIHLVAVRGKQLIALFGTLFRKGYIHFIETVYDIVVALSEFLLPLAYEFGSYAAEQFFLRRNHPIAERSAPMGLDKIEVRINPLHSLRNESGEAGTYRFHAQRAHAVEYLVGQGYLAPVPVGVQRAVNAAYIAHAHPGKVSGPDEVTVDFIIGKTELLQYPRKNRLITHKSQGHVETMKSHPVYFLFPAVPGPVGHGIAVSHHIEHIVVVEWRHCFFFCRRYILRRKVQIASRPATDAATVTLHEIIEAAAQSHRTGGCDRKRAVIGHTVTEIAFPFQIALAGVKHKIDRQAFLSRNTLYNSESGLLPMIRSRHTAICRHKQKTECKKQYFIHGGYR